MGTQKTRYFVAVGPDGLPIAQRNTVSRRNYQSANKGGSFSSKPPSTSHPLKVVEVTKPLVWFARAVLDDGRKVSDRSGMCAPGRRFIRYSYKHTHGQPERRERDAWINETREEFLRGVSTSLDYQIHAEAEAEREVRNWPTAGDSVVLK